jgi:alkaline phosphatase D
MPLSRRTLLAGAVAAPFVARGALAALANDPFSLGVASGDPMADGFVAWTRLAPDPLGDGGMPPDAADVEWVVASDPRLLRIVQRGTASASPDWGHSVHLELRGLDPDREYFYQFRWGGTASPVGRARTAPLPGAPMQRLRFAVASCQHYEQGYYAAYRHMLEDDPRVVFHLGDYIYENPSWAEEIRRHEGPEPLTLEDYRRRHALYKLDRDLQAIHAACPFVATWDDHEVDNDYASDQSQDRDDPAEFRKRRAAAYQAYWEHMPVRLAARPRGADSRLHRRLVFGNLAEAQVLDGRQYRSDQPCGEGKPGGGNVVANCSERLAPERTMLGPEQERWLGGGLARSQARWNILAQQMMMAELKQKNAAGEVGFWTDGWDGYAAAREKLLRFIADRKVRNPVVLGGDIHSFWVTDLKPDFGNAEAPPVATEFVGTSITSAGAPHDQFAALLPDNPHIKFFEGRKRGYMLCDVTPERWTTHLRTVETVRDPAGNATTLGSWIVEDGKPGAVRM